ncbi:MAG: acetate/propionate family kinase [Pseudomonadota bacterium]
MRILTFNAGSSSLKFGVFSADLEPEELLTGSVERIGDDPVLSVSRVGHEDASYTLGAGAAPDHEAAVGVMLKAIEPAIEGQEIAAIGHRIVHGGAKFTDPVVIDGRVIDAILKLTPFAPLHQPHNLAGVHAAMSQFPNAKQVACFDTAFHRSHPWVNDAFALPRSFYDKGVRRYGFHGLSYDYVSGYLRSMAPHLAAGRVVVAHLGNGASICAMLDGRSISSTMGFSALDGLPMGTRCGQLDPGVILYLMEQEGMDAGAISDLLYRRSGLLGLSGLSNDMRTLLAARTREAEEAIDYYVFRIRRELGASAAALGGLDALVFCGGVGERSPDIRARVCDGLQWLGIELDHGRNTEGTTMISAELSRARVLVIPTKEEQVIARAAASHLAGHA